MTPTEQDEYVSVTFLRLTKVARACIRCGREVGLSDRQIVEGTLDGSLLTMIRIAEGAESAQRVLAGVLGPAFEEREL